METRSCVICGDNYAPRRSNQVTCRKASCLLANRNRTLKEARSNVAGGVEPARATLPLRDPPPAAPPPSIPTGHTLDLILDEVRALINLPHVLAVSITREGKVTALRGLPSESPFVDTDGESTNEDKREKDDRTLSHARDLDAYSFGGAR